MRRVRRVGRIHPGGIVVIVASALVMAACGSSDADTATGPPPAAADGAAGADAGLDAELAPADDAGAVLAAYVAAWEAGDWPAIQSLVSDPSLGADAIHRNVAESLGVVSTSIEVLDDPDAAGLDGSDLDSATIRLDVTVELDQIGPWTYPTEVTLVRTGDELGRVVEPGDGPPGAHRRSSPRRRAAVAAARRHRGRRWHGVARRPARWCRSASNPSASPIGRHSSTTSRPSSAPTPMTSPPPSMRPACSPTGSSRSPCSTTRSNRSPGQRSRASMVWSCRETDQRLGPSRSWARQVLGETGPITAELLADWGPPYRQGDIVGLSGLELAYERALAGSPRGDVRVVDRDGELVAVLQRLRGAEPVDVVTTLDPAVQNAAEAAFAGVTEPAALVAIDAASGEVRAVVSRPAGDFGRAFGGAYPPGSTFKIITAAAAIAAGASPASPAPCPAQDPARRSAVHQRRWGLVGLGGPGLVVRGVVQHGLRRPGSGPGRRRPGRRRSGFRRRCRVRHRLGCDRRQPPRPCRRRGARRPSHRAGARHRQPTRDGVHRRCGGGRVLA